MLPLQLTQVGGKPVYVNPEAIACFREDSLFKGRTILDMISGELQLAVVESVVEVADSLYMAHEP